MTAMSPEFYTIIAGSIALAGLILNGQRSLSASITELRQELRQEFRSEIGGLRTELNSLREQMHQEIAALSERVARLEGLLEGLRDAITGRAA